MICSFCNQEARNNCASCNRSFCSDCGDVICKECSSPKINNNEILLYKGSLISLLVGSVFFIWFVIGGQNSIKDMNEIKQQIIIQNTSQDTLAKEEVTVPVIIPVIIPIQKKIEEEKIEEEKIEEPSEKKDTLVEKELYEFYKVQDGDSLYAIAIKFIVLSYDIEVFLEEIIKLNELNNPNDLQIGQLIRLPNN